MYNMTAIILDIQYQVIKFVGDLRQVGGSPGIPVSSTNKTDRHDITDILLKVALNIKPNPSLLDIGEHMLFCPLMIRGNEKKIRPFLPFFVDAIIVKIYSTPQVCQSHGFNLFQKSLSSNDLIFLYFIYCTQNNRRVLQDFSIDDMKAKHPSCSCHNSSFTLSLAFHIIF